MAEPWKKYQGASPAGPWEKYGGKPPAARGPLGTADDLARMFAAGGSFEMADEFAGKMNSITRGGSYAENVAEERARDADIMDRMPVMSTIAKLTGMIANPITRKAGATRLTGYAGNAVQGLVQGALTGIGASTEENRVQGGVTGGLMGGAAGAAFPALVNGATALVRSGVNRFSAPATQFGRRLLTALQRDGLSIDDAMAYLRNMGDDAAIADLGGNVRGFAEAAAQTPGKALKAAEALTERQFGQGERLLKDALNIVGVDSAENLIKQRSAAAAPWYKAAFSQDNYKTIKSDLIQRLMTRPDFQRGMRAGIKDVLDEAAITGDDLRSFNTFFEGANLDDPNLVLKTEPTLRILDAAKRGMDKILNSDELLNANGTKKQEWYRLNDMRKAMMKEVDRVLGNTPEGIAYKKAREAWGGPSDVIDGLRLIEKTIETARDGADITGRLYGSPAARAKLSTLFKDVKDGTALFRKAVDRERTFAQTNRQVTGNSRTAFRTAAQNDMADGAVDAAFNIAQNPTAANVVTQGLTAARNWWRTPPTAVADEAASLFSTDPAVRDAAFNQLRNRTTGQQLLDRIIGPRAPSLLGGAAAVGGQSGGLLGSSR